MFDIVEWWKESKVLAADLLRDTNLYLNSTQYSPTLNNHRPMQFPAHLGHLETDALQWW
jgi:hypothetical protein